MFPTNDRILMEADVFKITTVRQSLMLELIKAGRFPRSLVLSDKRRGWRASDIDKWIANLKETESADTGADKSVEPVESVEPVKPSAGAVVKKFLNESDGDSAEPGAGEIK